MTYAVLRSDPRLPRSGAMGIQPRLAQGLALVNSPPMAIYGSGAANSNTRTFGGPGGLDRRTSAMLENWRRANPYVPRSYFAGWARMMPLVGAALAAFSYLDFLADARERALREPDETLTPTGFGMARTLAGSSLLRGGSPFEFFGRTKAGIYASPDIAVQAIPPFGPQWNFLPNPTSMYGPEFRMNPSGQAEFPFKGVWTTSPPAPGLSEFAWAMQPILPAMMAQPKTNPGKYWKPEEVYYFGRPPVPRPITNLSIQFGPTVTIRENVPPVRPPPGVRDRKTVMPPPVAIALGLMTESLDFLDILYRASGGQDYPSLSFSDKMRWLFLGGGLANFDLATFVKLFLAEQFSDAMIAILARRGNSGFLQLMRKYGDPDRVAGLLWGPAM